MSELARPQYLDDTDTTNQQHTQALNIVARTHGWRFMQDATMRMLDGSCLYDLAHHGRRYQNYLFGDDWEYVEVGFKTSGQRGLSRLKHRVVHYSVMRVTLPRKLPNVVFDSLEHQQRQFRMVFEGSQYIRLEGNFNKYFATYFGKGYTIDDLSFITPEVMEALLAARTYDIEIVHNSLLLFGQIQTDPQTQLQDMSQAIHTIRQKLLNNILTYRDERLPYDEGRRVVARAGMFLGKQTRLPLLFMALLTIIIMLPLIILFVLAIVFPN